jgi:hypothetical protein
MCGWLMADRGCGQLDSQRKYTVTTGSYYSVVGREEGAGCEENRKIKM